MSDFILGEHAAEIRALKADVAELSGKMDRVVSFVDKIDGGWKVGASVLALAGAFIGASVGFIADYIKTRLFA